MSSNDVQAIYALLGENEVGVRTAVDLLLGLKTLFVAAENARQARFIGLEKELEALAKAGKDNELPKLIEKINVMGNKVNDIGNKINDIGKKANDALYGANQANKKIATQDKKTEELNKKIAAYNKRLDTLEKTFKLENQRVRDRVYKVEKQLPEIKKQLNDNLYEIREGRNIIEAKIAEARKLGNDALYEVRNKQKDDNRLTIAEKTIQNLYKLLFDGLQRIKFAQLKADEVAFDVEISVKPAIREVRGTVNKNDTKVTDAVNEIKALSRAFDSIPKVIDTKDLAKVDDLNGLKGKVNAVENTLKTDIDNARLSLEALSRISQAQIDALTTQDKTLAGGITNLANNDKKLEDAINRIDRKAIVPDLSPIQKALNDKFEAFVQQNNKDLGIRDLKLKDLTKSELSKEFDKRNADFERQSNLTSEQRFNEFQRQNAIDLKLKTQPIEKDVTTAKNDINDLLKKIKEREEVDKSVVDRLDKLIPAVALIPNKVIDGVKINTPTLPEINNEVGNAICKSFNGGCGRQALDKQSADINNAGKAANNDLLNKLNAGANAGQLAALEVINNKLGAQIPGGIGGKLVDGFKWLQLDRVLNVLTFAATVHNGFQLSGAIVETLGSALNNVLSVIGIKDDKDQPISISNLIGSSVNSVIVSIVGAENATQISNQWAKANRIYQASTNVLNNVFNLSQVILQANEMIAAYTGRIGNALRDGGVVLENAYGKMNPQPKFNRVTQTLEAFQGAASTVQMVTQVPLDFVNATTELTTASTEFTKAIKEDGKVDSSGNPVNKAPTLPEPEELKAQAIAAKAVSQPNPFDFPDFFDGSDL